MHLSAASRTDGSTVNILTIWWDDAADGPTNMAADECLAAEAERRGGPLLRLYRWSETTVSLGNFQRIDDARRIGAIRGTRLVRRPSGGGAIVHGTDLTYAAAVPKSHPWGASPSVFYHALHGAMVEALAEHGIRARQHVSEIPAAQVVSPGCVRDVPPRHDSARGEAPFFCFDRRSEGDLIMAGSGDRGPSKIMGSAQRRLAGVVLQHGSLLLRSNPAVEGPARHPGVADIVTDVPLPEQEGLSRTWCRHVANALEATVDNEGGAFSSGRESQIGVTSARFRDERWTARR